MPLFTLLIHAFNKYTHISAHLALRPGVDQRSSDANSDLKSSQSIWEHKALRRRKRSGSVDNSLVFGCGGDFEIPWVFQVVISSSHLEMSGAPDTALVWECR